MTLDYTTHPAILTKTCQCGNEHFRDNNLCADCELEREQLRFQIIGAYLLLEANISAASEFIGPELLESLGWRLIQEA